MTTLLHTEPESVLPLHAPLTAESRDSIAVPEDARCSSIIEAIKWRVLGQLGSMLRLDRFPTKRLGRGPVLVQLGAGLDMHPNFVNADFFHVPLVMRRPKPDWSMDITRPLRCPDAYVDGIFTQHTLEHISPRQVLGLLRECRRVLKRGSCMRVVVPDAERYALAVAGLGRLPDHGRTYALPIEGLRAVSQDFGHRSLWSPELMRRYMAAAGFRETRIESFGRGRDRRLLLDTVARKDESLFVEGVA
jgi:predicted SAM-dependent methyltransferase